MMSFATFSEKSSLKKFLPQNPLLKNLLEFVVIIFPNKLNFSKEKAKHSEINIVSGLQFHHNEVIKYTDQSKNN